MKRFIEGEDRMQVVLLQQCLDDFIAEDNPVRVVDAFVEELNLRELGFKSVEPSSTGRPSYPRQSCSSSTSMVISIASSRAAGWNVKPSATSN